MAMSLSLAVSAGAAFNDQDDINYGVAVDTMVELGVINDERYSRMLVRHYAGKGYGTCRIKQELYRHGIHTDLWEEALEELPTQEEIMDKLLRSKLRSSCPDQKEIKKATDALLRRGFSWSEISACKNRVLNDCDDYEY